MTKSKVYLSEGKKMILHNIQGTQPQVEFLGHKGITSAYFMSSKNRYSIETYYSFPLLHNFHTLKDIKEWAEEEGLLDLNEKITPPLGEGDIVEMNIDSEKALTLSIQELSLDEQALYKEVYNAQEEIVVLEAITGSFDSLGGYYLSYISKEHNPFRIGNSFKPFLFSQSLIKGVHE